MLFVEILVVKQNSGSKKNHKKVKIRDFHFKPVLFCFGFGFYFDRFRTQTAYAS